MTDQVDPDSAPQRKRIAVACGRCRKRKIRCSGDPGQGQPCSNCKNAGVDQCQFLRVSSREAPIRHDVGDFGYSVGDARVYANRTPVGGGLPCAPELPTLGSSDVLGSYRGGSAYAYTPASRTYYPAMHAYGTPYPEDYELGLAVPPPSVMNPEPVGMLPGQWSSGARTKTPSFGGVYVDTDGAYSSYNSTSTMVHRPPQSVGSDAPNFSFSGVAASLPLSSTPGPDRLLPHPAGRPSVLPYPIPAKPAGSVSASGPTALADMATAASYAGGFDPPGLSFSSAASSSLSSHPSPSSRANSDSYAGSDGIFSAQERSLQSQGPAFEMSSYTASPRRGSTSGGGAGLSHSFDSADSAHHQASQHHLQGAYMSDAPPASPAAHRGNHGQSVAPGIGSTSQAAHNGDRQAGAVASRH